MHTHFSLTLHISWSIICLFCPFFVIAYLKLSLPSKKWISFGSLCRRHVRRSVHVTALADRVWLVVLPVSEMSRVKNGSIDQFVQISQTSPGSRKSFQPYTINLCVFGSSHHLNAILAVDVVTRVASIQQEVVAGLCRGPFQLVQTHFNKKNCLFFSVSQILKTIFYSSSKRNSQPIKTLSLRFGLLGCPLVQS